jgi:hypothetical protein
MTSPFHDVRYAVRGLRKNPGFPASRSHHAGLGIGANTAIFSVMYVKLHKALPLNSPQSRSSSSGRTLAFPG